MRGRSTWRCEKRATKVEEQKPGCERREIKNAVIGNHVTHGGSL